MVPVVNNDSDLMWAIFFSVHMFGNMSLASQADREGKTKSGNFYRVLAVIAGVAVIWNMMSMVLR